MANREVAVSMRDITKVFGTVKANNKVNLDIYRGEILSLLGENGSGKTTLMNMLSGIYYPDGGEVYINGELAAIHSPKEAFGYGIGMIHQHFKLVDVFTATENIILGLKEEGKLDLKKAAASVGEKSVEMMKSKELLDQTGYVHGGCSPLCMKKEMRTVVDSSIQNFDTVYFSAGKIGLQIEMSSKDFLGYTKFKTESISREPANVDRVQST